MRFSLTNGKPKSIFVHTCVELRKKHTTNRYLTQQVQALRFKINKYYFENTCYLFKNLSTLLK